MHAPDINTNIPKQKHQPLCIFKNKYGTWCIQTEQTQNNLHKTNFTHKKYS